MSSAGKCLKTFPSSNKYYSLKRFIIYIYSNSRCMSFDESSLRFDSYDPELSVCRSSCALNFAAIYSSSVNSLGTALGFGYLGEAVRSYYRFKCLCTQLCVDCSHGPEDTEVRRQRGWNLRYAVHNVPVYREEKRRTNKDCASSSPIALRRPHAASN